MSLARRQFLKTVGSASVLASAPSLLRAQSKEHIVVIGGGFAGATVAKYLRLWGAADVNVTLVDPRSAHISCVMSNLVLNGVLRLQDLSLSYDRLANQYGVAVHADRAEEIDHYARRVKLEAGGWLSYDRIVLAPGIAFDDITGWERDKIPHAWIAGDQTNMLRDQINSMPELGTFIMSIPKAPFRCPPGPYERACLVADIIKRRGGGKVIVLDANDSIQAERETFSRAFTGLYANIIDYRTNTEVTGIDSDARVLTTSTGELMGDVINLIPRHAAPAILTNSGLTEGGRWAPVNPLTYESTISGFDGAYVLGDSQGTKQPKSGHMANAQAKICADAIVRAVKGQSTDSAERVANVTTNSACYSPITRDKASWLTANYQYSAATGDMQLTHVGEAEHWSRENFEEMYSWAENLFADSFR